MNLHEQIMNIQTPALLTFRGDDSPLLAYNVGHRDARHAAAELALKADAEVEALRNAIAALLALPVAVKELAYLRKGVGTATENAAWLNAARLLGDA